MSMGCFSESMELSFLRISSVVVGNLPPLALAANWSRPALRALMVPSLLYSVESTERCWNMAALEGMLVMYTRGRRPAKRPVPPRTFRLRSPNTSQVKPTRGDTWMLVLGQRPVSRCLPPKSRALMALLVIRSLLSYRMVSKRTPAVSLKRSVAAHSSWKYRPIWLNWIRAEGVSLPP